MQATKARARQLMRQRLSLICIDRNQSAMRFYKRLGFEATHVGMKLYL